MTFDPVGGWILLSLVTLVLLGGVGFLAVTRPEKRWTWCLRGAAVLLLALAFARPSTTMTIPAAQREATADVFFVVDTTASMVAEDFDGDGTRLDGAKDDMEQLIEALPGAHFSVITFDSSAVTRVPLTTDDSAVRSTIEILGPEVTTYSSGSSITEAGDLLVERLEASRLADPENTRLVYYFGDGEQTSDEAPEPMDAVAGLVDGGATFGYGTTEGGPMKETLSYYAQSDEPSYIVDPSTGKAAVSRIDEDALRDIAAQTGTEYVHRSAPAEVSALVEIPQLQSRMVDTKSVTALTEYFWVPLLLVFVWLLVDTTCVLREVRSTALVSRPPRGTRRSVPVPVDRNDGRWPR